MAFFSGLSVGTLVYIALALQLVGFLARGELRLRLFMLAASVFYLLYYFRIADEPLWDALAVNLALVLVNTTMICVILVERTTIGMSGDRRALYAQFEGLLPGHFRRLLRLATDVRVDGETRIVEAGALLDRLFFVIDGPLVVEKDGSAVEIGGGTFIGEVAYLTGRPASASVRLGPGARYLCWRRDDLDRMTRRSPNFRNALLARINADLAVKVAGSMPQAQT